MKHIEILYLLFLEYLEYKADQCMHRDDWKALERVKEIIKYDSKHR